MEIIFVKKKLEKIFNSADRLQREYGENADKIKIRMDVLMAADNLSQIPAQRPERRHELSGKRQGIFVVDLKHPFRLLFKPNYNSVPTKEDGGVNLKKIKSIIIIGVEDYY